MSEPLGKRYWKSPEARDRGPEFLAAAAREFPEPLPRDRAGLSRRDFLSLAGFGFAAVASGCSQAPERKALPHTAAPEDLVAGRVLEYATTCQACSAGCGLLARCRDGRPIKLEGNPAHPWSAGGLCAVGQASILGLYDRKRIAQPLLDGKETGWAQADSEISAALAGIRGQKGGVRVLSHSILSPTTRVEIQRFLGQFPDGRHVVYDALSCSAIRDAHQRTHGRAVLPHFRLEKAEVIVGLDADFLGTWISPVEFSRAYRAGRSLEGDPPRCSWHVQLESRLSLSGAKADLRLRVAPYEMGLVLSALAERLARKAGSAWAAPGLGAPAIPARTLDELAERLWAAKGRSVVLCGSQDLEQQILCNFVNHLLGNYGVTVDIERPSLQRQGNDADLAALYEELKGGKVSALFVLGANPVYELPQGREWAALLKGLPLTVCCAERLDETAAVARYVCPNPHYLAAWGDAEAVEGSFSLAQPLFPVLGGARPVLESLAAWSGKPATARDLIQSHWKTAIFGKQTGQSDFQAFWDRAVHDGCLQLPAEAGKPYAFTEAAVRPVLQATGPERGRFALVLYPTLGLLDGSQAYNPWLQELPDPITKVSWDNYVCVGVATARELNLADGDLVRVQAGEVSVELPALVQPGQHERVLAIPLGFGSRLSERFTEIGPRWLQGKPTLGEHGQVGRNAAPLGVLEGGLVRGGQPAAQIAPLGRRASLACSQTHHSIEVPAGLAPAGQERRPMIQELTLAGLHAPARAGGHGWKDADLWPDDHAAAGPRWGMIIDLNACTGCSACVVACQVENNIPVVGKDEVERQREMHWLRVDRYYAEAGGGQGEVDVAFQPMLCQHCGNAPCETVCPVLATVHSTEGLNQQVYNRCVGTRYCANNCPYKVRRFNWFDYAHEDALQNLVLNPDVTVRSRGVMEKCSFCTQRIQEAKAEARRQGVPLAEGAIQPACQQSCPSGAISFGDLNNAASGAARLALEGRSYQVLPELNVKPAIHYRKVVRNRPHVEGAAHD